MPEMKPILWGIRRPDGVVERPRENESPTACYTAYAKKRNTSWEALKSLGYTVITVEHSRAPKPAPASGGTSA